MSTKEIVPNKNCSLLYTLGVVLTWVWSLIPSLLHPLFKFRIELTSGSIPEFLCMCKNISYDTNSPFYMQTIHLIAHLHVYFVYTAQ